MLYKLDHTHTPAGITELHETMQEVLLEDVSNIPFVFIRGVKMQGKELEDTDMMRGEETELAGIIQNGGGVYILPGSHSKVITVNALGRITKFFTALTGEMILSLSQNTILKGSIDLDISAIDEEYLLKGYDYCKKQGINEALFKTRVLDTIFKASREALYSFYLGVILAYEVIKIIESNPEKITVGGKKQIKEALVLILKNRTDAEIISLPDDIVDNCVSLGAVKIFEYNK